jgi:formylglycine-generating enzyme required for sulfatase activity
MALAVSAPALDSFVTLEAGVYRLGEGARERTIDLGTLLIGRWPVVNAQVREFAEATGWAPEGALTARLRSPMLEDHPATELSFEDAVAFCDWAGTVLHLPVRLPSGDEWEAAARGHDGRAWPWGPTFDEGRCACAEASTGTTVPVTSHPSGASACGAEQLAGNVWEWVDGPTDRGGWGAVRGGSYLDYAWGVRAARSLPADRRHRTPNTGFRIVADLKEEHD